MKKMVIFQEASDIQPKDHTTWIGRYEFRVAIWLTLVLNEISIMLEGLMIQNDRISTLENRAFIAGCLSKIMLRVLHM